VDRGEVFGVEAQRLALNEALVIRSKKVPNLSMPGTFKDHPATQFNDSLQDRYYTYLELQNVSAYSVPLGQGSWEISVDDQTGTMDQWRVILTDGGASVAPGAMYTIGSRTYVSGGSDDIGVGNPYPS
jgi:hypothetical protein